MLHQPFDGSEGELAWFSAMTWQCLRCGEWFVMAQQQAHDNVLENGRRQAANSKQQRQVTDGGWQGWQQG